ncbi:hypothetical protein Dalk_3207 [Desulfatibacillum aliphaticivorans]|uniref:Uncharacterized protein n=1 Tax=Desulfatibacillum aliphaticivorans TaxID=218208 RepID=B8FGI8_DESAL|nr:hypothetical protein [Desulfatibacillum aliphaticivorans]ACL04897.1 hypothetical protein Dalk_3207 [Desulfatibacillum aliphaticivorans]
MNENLENLAIKAKQGDKHALENLVRAIRRMLDSEKFQELKTLNQEDTPWKK